MSAARRSGSLVAAGLFAVGALCPAAAPASGLTAEQAFVACEGCHSIEVGAPHGVGPNLNGIADRPAASLVDYPYSPALRESKLVWNRGTLTGWILMAEHMVPGTWMLYYNELEPDEVHRLVDWLLRHR